MPKIQGIDVAKSDHLKNYIINGDMGIWQRGISFGSIENGSYCADRFVYGKSGTTVHTIQQSADVPTVAQARQLFPYSLLLQLGTPDTSLAATDFAAISQLVEGYNWAKLAQKVCTLSFWVKATLPGTYCVSLNNSGGDRCIVFEYTIDVTDTWEKKTIVIPPSPTAGTWDYASGAGVRIQWTLAAGTDLHTATIGSWQNGNLKATVNQINGVNTGATNFRITGVMLNEGAVAAPFKLFADGFNGELAACQRYYEKSFNLTVAPANGPDASNFADLSGIARGISSNSESGCYIKFSVPKRANATRTLYGNNSGQTAYTTVSSGTFVWHANATVTGGGGTIGHQGFAVSNQALSGTYVQLQFHWAADAEL